MGSADKSIRPWDDPSTEPNGFGLTIAGADSAVQELCEDPGVLRGGDLAIGMLERDFFTGYWLPLAPSFQDRVPPSEQGMPRTQLAVRRARSLPELAKRMIARPERSPK